MKNIFFFKNISTGIWLLLFSIGAVTACEQSEKDTEKPVIDLSVAGAFPLNCDTLWFGEPFTFVAQLSDNIALGAYTIEIHHNFDHHSHSTEVSTCALLPKKIAINPYHYIQDYEIPSGLNSTRAELQLVIPITGQKGNFDDGDYHFYIGLTDQEGWSAQRGLNIKILHRNSDPS